MSLHAGDIAENAHTVEWVLNIFEHMSGCVKATSERTKLSDGIGGNERLVASVKPRFNMRSTGAMNRRQNRN